MVVEPLLEFVLENPEWGWLFVIAGGAEQLFAPWQTKTKALVYRVEARLEAVEHMQKAQMTVIRALARTDGEIETKKVDEYLVENGVHPETFIKGSKVDAEAWPEEEAESATKHVGDLYGED